MAAGHCLGCNGRCWAARHKTPVHVPAHGQLACVLLILWTAVAQAATDVPISGGQQFATAVQNWTRTGGDVNLLISNTSSVSLQTALFAPPNNTFLPGHLVMLGTAGQDVVLDLGMKAFLTQQWEVASATLVMQNLIVTNLCSWWLLWNRDSAQYILTASQLFLLPRSRSVATQTRRTVTMYVPYGEVLAMTYWQLMERIPFTPIKNKNSAGLLKYVAPTNGVVSSVGMYHITLAQTTLPGGFDYNVTYAATNNPASPPQFQVPPAGTLMPHRFCTLFGNGTQLTTAEQGFNSTIFPLWIVNDNTTLGHALEGASAFTVTKAVQDPTATILLVGPASLSTAATLRQDLVLHGPPDNSGPPAQGVVLSLSGGTRTLSMATDAVLYVNKLTLTNLASGAVDGAGTTTALPLWAVNRAYLQDNTAPTALVMNSVTWVVPQADFIVLYSAALRGDQWATGAVATRGVMRRVTTFTLSPSVAPSRQAVVFAEYAGWGVAATQLTVVPDAPVGDEVAIPDPPGTGGSTSDSSTALAVGLGVGLGVGIPLLAGLTYWLYRKRRALHDPESVLDESDLKMPGTPNGAGGGPPGSPLPPSVYANRALMHKAVSDVQEAMGSSARMSDRRPSGVSDNGAGNGTAFVKASSNGKRSEPGLTGLADVDEGCRTPAGLVSAAPSVIESTPSTQPQNPKQAVAAKAGSISKSDADKLTLTAVLGRGAWGTVYKGTWRGLTVAVKTVLFSEREDGDSTLPHERAIMEAAVCTSVAHRNVVATYHYDIKPIRSVIDACDEGLQVEAAEDATSLGMTDWKLFLVQEWCNSTLGAALRQSLLHKKPTKEPYMDLLLELLLDIARGVAYLHDKNIIHGDLKPENVMLKTDTSASIGVVAKITDFGLSTTLAPQATHVSNYKSGTPFYVAPEVMAQGRTTKASDAYSTGVLMWEMYCCTPPWTKSNGEYVANPLFPTFPPNTPRLFMSLARACLHVDVKQRPTITTVVDQLQQMLEAWRLGFDSLSVPAGYVPTGPLSRPAGGNPPGAAALAGATASTGSPARARTTNGSGSPAPGPNDDGLTR